MNIGDIFISRGPTIKLLLWRIIMNIWGHFYRYNKVPLMGNKNEHW